MDELVLTRKIKLWENRLLDLSKRNRMISFKDSSAQVLRFINPGFEQLFQTLVVNGKPLQIRRPFDPTVNSAVHSIVRLMHHLSAPLDINKLDQGQIRTDRTLESSLRVVRNIKKYADLSMQEKGTNVLYLSFGFLYWQDRDTKGAWLKAPLVLVPATLTQDTLLHPYSVEKTDEEILVNPTFAYYLDVNYGIHLPTLKNISSFQALTGFLEQVASAVEPLGWYVEQEVYLSTMSFLKTNMYNDLVANEERILAHPVIRAFAGEQNACTTLNEADTNFLHDSTDVENVFEVLNADSSQKDAVELSRRGISFVMQGPPGTGKSQTIANIITQGIAEGKKILFVSEKQAALDVVYRRLRDAQLSELCLPLHDPKTSRMIVVKEIERNLDLVKTYIGNDKLAELHRLHQLRDELNAYSIHLHQKISPLNMSIYEAYQLLFDLADIDDVVAPLPDPSSVNRAAMNRMIQEVSEYAATRSALGENWYANPWLGIKRRHLSNIGKQRLKESIENLLQKLEFFCKYQLHDNKHLADIITWDNRLEYEAVGRLIASHSIVPEALVLSSDGQDTCNTNADISALASFYNSEPDALLSHRDVHKSYSLTTAERFARLVDALAPIEGLSTQLTYLDLFHLLAFMQDHGLTENDLSVTEHYFSPQGLSDIARIRSEHRAKFQRADHLRSQLLHRYNEAVLELDLGSDSQHRADILHQLSDYGSNNIEALLQLLDTEFNIHPTQQSGAEELPNVLNVLLDGRFDHFAPLSENELFFVYSLMEEAAQRAKANDVQWFSDYQQLLQQYTGQDHISMQAGIWESYVILVNDFYYIKSLYPELLPLTSLSSQDKERLQKMLERPASDQTLALHIAECLQKVSLQPQSFTSQMLCEDVSSIWEYQDIYKHSEEAYKENAAIVGNMYLMGSTDWDLIERNIDFIKAASDHFRAADFQRIRLLLINANRIDWAPLYQVLQHMTASGQNIPQIETLPIAQVASILQENAAKLDKAGISNDISVAQQRIAEKIKARVYRDGELLIDRDLLRMMLNNSTQLFDVLDLLCGLALAQSDLENYLDAYDLPQRLTEISISDLYSRLQACLEHFSTYDTMVEYQLCAEHCREDGLNAFIAKVYQMHLENVIGQVLKKTFLTAWVDMVSENAESISAFSSRVQEHKIRDFADLDEKQFHIARTRLQAIFRSNIPSRSSGKVVGEMGILLREISKHRNCMTIRQLFDSIPTLLTTLKPCLMMSPLSVSYFLKAELYNFDMVIFDEASQIFPENAISAILRGKQVIIAGDSKQMPPTSFFHGSINGNEESIEEDGSFNSNSILEEAENALPNLSLTWHYRSQNENLITFSNQHMYAGSLVTFPNCMPKKADSGVEYVYVEDGVYENRCNQGEARACVELAVRHFVMHPERSLGIIAFSTTQEECIERAFEAFRSRNPQYEEFFRETRENPFFIKNLENVQGDERDTILLSVGYGKNAQGILRYNFGPLGQQGGERRMNVAITRAKHNIKLVTSLAPDDFNKAKTETNAGAKLLHDYIKYALQGQGAEAASGNTVIDDGFKRHIVSVLQSAGHEIALNVGDSGYKVEIAVKDPHQPNSYIVGIETDGPAYHQVRTARDRECLRPSILRNMGWQLYRVWSTQWMRDPKTEQKKLLDFIDRAIMQSAPGTEPITVQAAEETAPPETPISNKESSDA